jgi:hypothetical protein
MFYLLSIAIMNEFSQIHVWLFSTSSLLVCFNLLVRRFTSTYSCKLFSIFIISFLDLLFKLVHVVIVIYLIYLFKHFDILDVGIIYWARFLNAFCTCAMSSCYLVHGTSYFIFTTSIEHLTGFMTLLLVYLLFLLCPINIYILFTKGNNFLLILGFVMLVISLCPTCSTVMHPQAPW